MRIRDIIVANLYHGWLVVGLVKTLGCLNYSPWVQSKVRGRFWWFARGWLFSRVGGLPGGSPLAVGAGDARLDHGFGVLALPPSTRDLEPGVEDVAVAGLDEAAADGQVRRESGGVARVGLAGWQGSAGRNAPGPPPRALRAARWRPPAARAPRHSGWL